MIRNHPLWRIGTALALLLFGRKGLISQPIPQAIGLKTARLRWSIALIEGQSALARNSCDCKGRALQNN